LSWLTDQQTPPSQSSSPLFYFLLLQWPKEAEAVQAVAVPRAQQGVQAARLALVPRAQRGVQAARLALVPRAEQVPRPEEVLRQAATAPVQPTQVVLAVQPLAVPRWGPVAPPIQPSTWAGQPRAELLRHQLASRVAIQAPAFLLRRARRLAIALPSRTLFQRMAHPLPV
jgi:hypothetical protein